MIQVRHKKRMGTEGLSFYPPPAVLPRSDAGSDGVKPAPCFVIQNYQTHYFLRCMDHVKIMWSAACSLVPHLHFAEEARCHLCMDETKRPTPLRKAIEFDPGCSGQTHSNRPCADPRNVHTER